MTLALTDAQIQKAHSAKPMQVALVKLTTYSDYTAETVASTFYWSSVPLLYRWDGATVNQFQGFLRGVSDVTRNMPHLPDDEQLATLTNLRLELSNEDWGTESLWKVLDAENLVAAKVEVASLLLDWSTATDSSWIDQSTTTADHIVRWRGEVDGMPEFDSEATSFVIECVTKEKPLPWPRALETTEVSAKHLGKLYPVPVGTTRRVELVQRQVGWVTTISSDITDTTTSNIVVADASGFPAAPTVFRIWLGSELCSAVYVSNIVIEITGRGLTAGNQTTVATPHKAGATMIEETATPRFVYSGIDALGVDALYARNPGTGELALVPPGYYGQVPADQELDAGLKLGVVMFTTQLWAALIKLLNESARVTQQPVYVESSNMRTDVAARVTVAAPGGGGGYPSDASLVGSVGTVEYDAAVNEAVWFYWLNGDLSSTTDVVVRARMHVEYTISSDPSASTAVVFQTQGGLLNFGFGAGLFHGYTLGAGAATEVRSVVSSWKACAGGTTVADILNGVSFSNSSPGIHMVCNGGGSSGGISANRTNVSLELEIAGSGISQTLPTVTTGAHELGFNLDLYADVRGAVRLGTATANTTMDSVVQPGPDWVGVGGTLADHAGDGITMTGSGTATERNIAKQGITPAIDMSGARVRFDVKVSAADLALFEGSAYAFQVLLLSSASNSVTWGWPLNAFHGTGDWETFSFDPSGNPTQVVESEGSLDLSNIIQIYVYWNTTISTSTGALSLRHLVIEERSYPTHPIDVAEWLIEDQMGEAVNASSFSTATTNLPSVVMGGDLRDAGGTFSEVLGRIGFESRTNFIGSEATAVTEYKALNALATYAFPASGASLVVGDYGALKVSTKQIGERPTEFTAIFDRHHDYALSDLLAYRDLLQANTTTNDLASDGVLTATLTAQQALVGVRPSGVEVFTLLINSTSAIEVWAYYVAEALRGTAKRFSMELPYRHSYALELGDILTLTPTYTASTVKVRVTALAFSFTEPTILVSAEEVL